MVLTQDQTSQIETLSKTFAETILKFVYNPNDIVIGSNLAPEKIEQTFDKLFENQHCLDFLKLNHQKYNLINVMGNNELFITYICDKLKDDINKSLTDQEETDLIAAVKEYFSSDDLMTKLFTQDELNEQVANNSEITDVFDKDTLDTFVSERVKNDSISDYYTDDEIIEHLKNSDVDINDLINEEVVKNWIADNNTTTIDDLFEDSDINDFLTDLDITNTSNECKRNMFEKLIDDTEFLSDCTKEQKIFMLKSLVESL